MFKYTLFFFSFLIISCSSRTLEIDYKVVDASHKEIPEWVSDLEDWVDDEQAETYSKFRYYMYTTEAKNSRSTACEIAKVRAVASIASEISTFIKHSFAQVKSGDPVSKSVELVEYIQDDLVKDVQASIVGAQEYRTYWEKRRFLKSKGAKQDWSGFTCTHLVKIPKTNLENAFKRAQESLNEKSSKEAKLRVSEIINKAQESYLDI